MTTQTKHKNYETLNLIGYGLAKFGAEFIRCFGFTTKNSFYEYLVRIGVADTVGTVKNRQDLFDPFFDNGRKGWWQKGDAYIHRKIHIDALFGEFNVTEFSKMVKLHVQAKYDESELNDVSISPLVKTKFKQLQITGKEAEIFFMNNFNKHNSLKGGVLEDARMFGDGYDFQIAIDQKFLLAEIKGLRQSQGAIRMTQKEFSVAKEYKDDYVLVVITNLAESPNMNVVFNPTAKIDFTKKMIQSRQANYHTKALLWENKHERN